MFVLVNFIVPPTPRSVSTVMALPAMPCQENLQMSFGPEILVAVVNPCSGNMPSLIAKTFISNADRKKDGNDAPIIAKPTQYSHMTVLIYCSLDSHRYTDYDFRMYDIKAIRRISRYSRTKPLLQACHTKERPRLPFMTLLSHFAPTPKYACKAYRPNHRVPLERTSSLVMARFARSRRLIVNVVCWHKHGKHVYQD